VLVLKGRARQLIGKPALTVAGVIDRGAAAH
jgi:hypothetical protein